MVASTLQGLVDTPAREELTAEEMIAESGAREGSRRRTEVPTDVARPLIHGHLDRHYRKTLDEPVLALGNVSPREAARSDAGRSNVVDWLKDIENHAAKAGDGGERHQDAQALGSNRRTHHPAGLRVAHGRWRSDV